MTTFCFGSNLNNQECKNTLYERISKLLDDVEWSDVTFLVRNEEIKAHKLILATSSPVFQAMLYGPMAENNEIVITDIEPEVFQLLLDFIYKDKVMIDCLENAMGLLYASKKYLLPYLTDICDNYIKSVTSVVNVLSVYRFSEWLQQESLIKYSLSIISKHADVILNKYFQHIPARCLITIVQESSINISEKDLIQVCWMWSHQECVERGISPTNIARRQMLFNSGVYTYLRFFTLSTHDYDSIKQLGILTNEQINYIDNLKMNASNQQLLDKFEFDMTRELRQTVSFDWLICRRAVIRSASPLLIVNSSQSVEVRFKCDKTVFIGNIFIPSRQSPNSFPMLSLSDYYLENLNINLSNSNKCEESVSVAFNQPVPYDSTMLVDFPKPFIIHANQWYTLNVFWPNTLLQRFRYSLCYRPINVSTSGTMFTFDDKCSHSTFWGSLLEGLTFSI